MARVFQTINNNDDFSYCQTEKLGEGRGTCVFLGKFKAFPCEEEQEVAVKRIQLADLNPKLGQREIENLGKLQHEPQHEHIVKFLRFEDDDDFRYIIAEI